MAERVKKLKLFIFLVSASLFGALRVFAESLETDWPDSPLGTPLEIDSGIAELVKYLYEWGIVIGIIIFFGILIYAGFEYLTSAGKPERLSSARKRIFSGFAGVLLLLGSFLLLNTINPELTEIKRVEFALEDPGFHEFQAGIGDDEKMCEFAFITVQEVDTEDQLTYLAIPGMSIKTEEVLPMQSYACVPERNENAILEVRRNETEGYYKLVRQRTGVEVDSEDFEFDYERVRYRHPDTDEELPLGDYEEALQELYAMRYEKMDTITINIDSKTQRDLYSFWSVARERGLYNTFVPDVCYTGRDGELGMVKNSEFERIRCLELSDGGLEEGGQVEITEWRKRGYASLAKAWVAMDDTPEDLDRDTTCPTAEEMGAETNLGYKRDSAGGGCSLAFYDGTELERRWYWFGKDYIPICEKQISRPAADMDHFDGIVDREANCMELIRHEAPLEVDPSVFQIQVTLDRSAAGNDDEYIAFCRGHQQNCYKEREEYMEIIETGDSTTFPVLPGSYTATVSEPCPPGPPGGGYTGIGCIRSPDYRFASPEQCEGRISCEIEIDEKDVEFKIRPKY